MLKILKIRGSTNGAHFSRHSNSSPMRSIGGSGRKHRASSSRSIRSRSNSVHALNQNGSYQGTDMMFKKRPSTIHSERSTISERKQRRIKNSSLTAANKRYLVNIGSIKMSFDRKEAGFSNVKSSLHSAARKREQDKQLEDNIKMLKKIHFAQPTIKFNEYKAHEKKVGKLKQQISSGTSGYAMMQAARDMIISTEIESAMRKSGTASMRRYVNSFGLNQNARNMGPNLNGPKSYKAPTQREISSFMNPSFKSSKKGSRLGSARSSRRGSSERPSSQLKAPMGTSQQSLKMVRLLGGRSSHGLPQVSRA